MLFKNNNINNKQLRDNLRFTKKNRIKLPSLIPLFKNRYSIKLKSKSLLAFNFTLKKKINFINQVLKSFLNKKLNWLSLKFCVINLILKFRRNTFLNFSHFNGNIIKNYSCGHYYKKSLKRTYFALNAVMLQSNIDTKYIYFKKWFIFNIVYKFYSRKILRNLRELFLITPYRLKFINFIKAKAHNGIRKRKQRRK